MICKAEGYVILAETSNTKLEKDVNDMLSSGWKLYGYPWVHDQIFFQAMIIEDLPLIVKQKKTKKGKK